MNLWIATQPWLDKYRETPQHPVISFAAALRIPDAMPTNEMVRRLIP
jgi:hypothetical protein